MDAITMLAFIAKSSFTSPPPCKGVGGASSSPFPFLPGGEGGGTIGPRFFHSS